MHPDHDRQEDEIKLLRVGELARLARKSVRALHLYEELGLLQPDGRTKGGFRLYTRAALQRVKWIGNLQDMGFSLTEVQVLLRDWMRIKAAPRAMSRIREILTKRLKQIQEHLDRLEALKKDIVDSLAYLDHCASCGAQSQAECARCAGNDAPMLVAQFHRPPTGEYTKLDIP